MVIGLFVVTSCGIGCYSLVYFQSAEVPKWSLAGRRAEWIPCSVFSHASITLDNDKIIKYLADFYEHYADQAGACPSIDPCCHCSTRPTIDLYWFRMQSEVVFASVDSHRWPPSTWSHSHSPSLFYEFSISSCTPISLHPSTFCIKRLLFL